jgi:hypothetical protein
MTDKNVEKDTVEETAKDRDRSDYFVSDGDEFTLEKPAGADKS